MNSHARATALAALFWLLLLGGLLALGVQWWWNLHETAARQIETVEPRYARLLGLGNDKTRLQEVTAQVARDIERHAYPGSRDASQAGNDAQQRVRDAFSKSGLDVISIQVLPARATRHFDRIPIAMRVEGELPTMQATLAALPGLSPSLFVEALTVQAANTTPGGVARVAVELQLFALRLRP